MPENIIISVAGSFDENRIKQYFQDKLKCFSNSCYAGASAIPVKIPNTADYRPERKRINKDIEQAHLAMGIPTVRITDDRRYSLSLLSSIVGGGMSSRLFQNVREKKGLAYSVYSMTGFYKSSGIFVICAGIAKDRYHEALDAIEYEINRLMDETVLFDELTGAKEQHKSTYIFAQENVQAKMMANGRNLLTIGECPSQDDMLEILNAISLEDVEIAKSLISQKGEYSVVNVTG